MKMTVPPRDRVGDAGSPDLCRALREQVVEVEDASLALVCLEVCEVLSALIRIKRIHFGLQWFPILRVKDRTQKTI
ncbi:MAG: hypothetical protein WCH93_11210, partial [Actinomycetota bacterium]